MFNRLPPQIAKNYARLSRLSREGCWIAAGQIVSLLATLALVRVLTEKLSLQEYGELALGLTFATIINQVIMGGIINGFGRYYSIASEGRDVGGYLHAAANIMTGATAIVGVVTLIVIMGLIILGQLDWWGLIVAVAVLAVLSGYSGALNSILNAARQRASVAIHGGMDAILRACVAVGVLFWIGSNITVVVLGYVVAVAVVTVSQFIFLRQWLRKHGNLSHSSSYSDDWGRQIWQFSWPFSIFGIFTCIQLVCDRWALEIFAETSSVGQYTVLFQLGYAPIGVLTSVMMTVIGPILYQRSGSATDQVRNMSVHRLAWRITQASLIVTAMGVAATWAFHDWLFQVLVAEEYRGVSHFLPWVVLAGGLFAGGQMLALKLLSEIRPHALIAVKIGSALIGIAANLIGAWQFGIVGVVGALVLFSMIYLIWMIGMAWNSPVEAIEL